MSLFLWGIGFAYGQLNRVSSLLCSHALHIPIYTYNLHHRLFFLKSLAKMFDILRGMPKWGLGRKSVWASNNVKADYHGIFCDCVSCPLTKQVQGWLIFLCFSEFYYFMWEISKLQNVHKQRRQWHFLRVKNNYKDKVVISYASKIKGGRYFSYGFMA